MERKIRVLIVEDDEDFAYLIRKTMELRRAVFIKNDRIYFLDIPITEFLSFLPFHPFILA